MGSVSRRMPSTGQQTQRWWGGGGGGPPTDNRTHTGGPDVLAQTPSHTRSIEYAAHGHASTHLSRCHPLACLRAGWDCWTGGRHRIPEESPSGRSPRRQGHHCHRPRTGSDPLCTSRGRRTCKALQQLAWNGGEAVEHSTHRSTSRVRMAGMELAMTKAPCSPMPFSDKLTPGSQSAELS